MLYFLPAKGLPISVKAKLSGRSRSSFYYVPKKPKKDALVLDLIRPVLAENPYYGYKRIAMHLNMNHKRVYRVMRRAGLSSKAIRRKRSKNQYSVRKISLPNHIKDMMIETPNCVWAGDFTHITYQRREYYIATVMDLYTRQVIGWHIATHHSVELVNEALRMAVCKRVKSPLFFHSDHGSEYLSENFLEKLQASNITASNSQKGKPWQNGIQESFYHRLKQELGNVNRFPTIDRFIEALGLHFRAYNEKRIHSKLKKTPDAFYAQAVQTQSTKK